jgi:hypothetical protein
MRLEGDKVTDSIVQSTKQMQEKRCVITVLSCVGSSEE